MDSSHGAINADYAQTKSQKSQHHVFRTPATCDLCKAPRPGGRTSGDRQHGNGVSHGGSGQVETRGESDVFRVSPRASEAPFVGTALAQPVAGSAVADHS